MKQIKPLLHLFFTIVFLFNLISVVNGYRILELITKPLILGLIMVLFYTYAQKNHSIFKISLIAFLLSWLGDVLLMFTKNNELLFIAGLSAFLLSHLFYVYVFSKGEKKNSQKPHFAIHVLVIIIGVTLYAVLFKHLDFVLKIAVLFYAAAISAMLLLSIHRKGKVNLASYKLVLYGAILFLISDSILALNKFWLDIPYSGLWVMGTYSPAQYLIMLGLIEQTHTD